MRLILFEVYGFIFLALFPRPKALLFDFDWLEEFSTWLDDVFMLFRPGPVLTKSGRVVLTLLDY